MMRILGLPSRRRGKISLRRGADRECRGWWQILSCSTGSLFTRLSLACSSQQFLMLDVFAHTLFERVMCLSTQVSYTDDSAESTKKADAG